MLVKTLQKIFFFAIKASYILHVMHKTCHVAHEDNLRMAGECSASMRVLLLSPHTSVVSCAGRMPKVSFFPGMWPA
jgi:hypothetical protein